MKNKFSTIWRAAIALVLVFSLGMVFAAPTGASNAVPPPDTGTIIINKITLPPGVPDTFDFYFDDPTMVGPPVGSIGDGGQIVIPNVLTGPHDVTEDVPPGWMAMGGDTVNVNVGPCEVVEVTFMNFGGHLEVDIVECPDYDVPYSTTFVIKAEITNWMDSKMPPWGPWPPVEVTLTPTGSPVDIRTPNPVLLGHLDPGEMNTAAWTVHCNGQGPVKFEITTNYGGYDYCNANQVVEPGIAVMVTAPCEVCVNCTPPANQGTVDALITNTGNIALRDVQVILSKTGLGTATITGGTTRYIPLLPGLGTVWIHDLAQGVWPFTCTGEGTVDWEVSAQGFATCDVPPSLVEGDPVPPSPATGTASTNQTETIVDIPCVRGLQSTVNPAYTVGGSEPKYLPACDEPCQFMPPQTVPPDPNNWNTTGLPFAYDVVSTQQKFEVTVRVENCTNVQKNYDVTLFIPPGTALAAEPIHVFCVGQHSWIDPPPAPPYTISVSEVCGCCDVLITYILECTASTAGAVAPIWATVTQTAPAPPNGPWSSYDFGTSEGCHPAGIIQEDKVHLDSMLAAYVMDCTGCPVEVNSVAVSQDFDTRLCISNLLGEADAYDVVVDMTVLGLTTCAGDYDDIYIGDIPGGKSVCIWLSDIVGDLCHCDAPGQVEVRVDSLSGYDENTCELILTENIEPVCPLLIQQCPITVEIINPVYCEDICYGDFFAVKAKITNSGCFCDFVDVDVTLTWEGPGDVIISQGPNPFELPEVTCACDEDTIYEVSWEVHCVKPGDVTFHVCLESATGEYADGIPAKIQIAETQELPATVHQWPRPEIVVEIISPENLDTFVATSQEFAVTAVISNQTMYCDYCGDLVANPDGHFHDDFEHPEVLMFPVTINDLGLKLHPESGAHVLVEPAELPFDIPAGESATLTWTVKCDESGLIMMDAWAVADTHAPCPSLEACSFPILLWQYPTAHLEVEILETTPTIVNVSDVYDILYRVTNTGEADATEVEAIFSVIPEGTVLPAAGIDQGYTVDIGTLPGHGQDGFYEGSWTVHCKEACESTINITAEGFDENGWHKKQVCQSTGNFIIEDGCAIFGQTGYTGLGPAPTGAMAAVFVGEASGLMGPFNLNVPISFDGEDLGNMVAMGAVLPDMDYVSFHNHVESLLDICPDCPSLLDLLEWFNLQGVDKDVMIFVGQLVMDSMNDAVPSGCYDASAGLLQVINGHFNGAGVSLTAGLDVMTFLDGEYCSVMAQDALRPIEAKFIEDANVTVKQLESGGLDLGVIKTVDDPNPGIGDTVDYTITVTNYGPTNASGVVVTDTLWDTIVSYVSDVATQGTYDDTSGTWTIGNMTVGASATLMITAHVGAEVEFINEATVSCDQPDGNTLNNTDTAVINPSLAINLEQGWNFVSWPLIPDYPGIETSPGVLDDLAPLLTNLEVVWGNFDPVAGTWDSYDPESMTNTLTEMWDGIGFWIDMKTAGQAIVIEGQEQPDPPATLRVYPVVGGAGGYWNVIAFKSTTAKSPDVYLAGIAGQYTIIYGFDDGAYFIVGTLANPFLVPGLAYWIAVLESGNIFP